MQFVSKVVSLAVVLAASSAFAAFTIDDFSTTSTLTKTGPGSISQTTVAAGVAGGNRFETVTVAPLSGGSSNLKINSPIANVASMSSESGVDATVGLIYGNSADLNLNLSADNAFVIRVKKSDLIGITNTISVTTTGGGTAASTFTVPALVGLAGGPATPFDIVVPYASFAGGAVNFSDVDKIAYFFNPSDSADWQIQLLQTASVPEPTALGLLVPAGLLMARRRRA